MTARNSIIVVGKNSFLAKTFLASSHFRDNIIAVTHNEIPNLPLDSACCVINFSYEPRYFTNPYRLEFDTDFNIAEQLKDKAIHYIMFSSRMVYGVEAISPLDEGMVTVGQGNYGINKVISEQFVRRMLGDSCAILRLSNVFGFEPGRHTFMGHALKTLKENNFIALDIKETAFRDFLPVSIFSRILDRVIENKLSGIFNLGSGLETKVGDAARWIIEGYGSGELQVYPQKEENSFVLNTEKLENHIGDLCSSEDIKNSCINLGSQLQNG